MEYKFVLVRDKERYPITTIEAEVNELAKDGWMVICTLGERAVIMGRMVSTPLPSVFHEPAYKNFEYPLPTIAGNRP